MTYRNAGEDRNGQLRWVHILFFISGFPALLYQIVWQRALFTIYGVNIESVTVVVSAFMLGLGAGTLLGGMVSKSSRVSPLVIFGLAELATALFGIFSLKIFQAAARFTAGAPPLKTGLVCFALLLVPTAFMGSTLPILVAYLIRVSGQVGRSVASLYCVNTLGSAFACFLAAAFTMRHLGESGTVILAAAINSAIGIASLVVHFRGPGQNASSNARVTSHAASNAEHPKSAGPAKWHLPFPIALVVSGLAGFIALGYEILWYRAFVYAFADRAPTFAILLGSYLLGIALGANVSRAIFRRASGTDAQEQLRILAGFVIAANLLGFLVLPLTSFFALFQVVFGYLLVAFSAALLGATFPLISDLSVRPDAKAGSGVSLLYVSNIVGSTLGSFLVGYILMDYMNTQQMAVLLAVTGVALGAGILLATTKRAAQHVLALTVIVAMALAIMFAAKPLFNGLYERLGEKRHYTGDHYKYRVETKNGVIAVTNDDTVLSGGVYDGKFSTDLVTDANGIFRPFSLSLWHPAPRNILMIGLASGSWAQVIANHPEVEKLTVVDINPGYLQLIPKYKVVASLLHNPKVTIVIDDGRRWLVRNPEAAYDVIVMNTTYNWRSNTTNLLSVEFLQLAHRHLSPGGVLFYNTTYSARAQFTGVAVFPYGLLVGSCMAVSDSSIDPNLNRWKQIVTQYKIDGVPVFRLERDNDQRKLAELISMFGSLEGADQIRKRTAGSRLITDDNMGSEW